MRFTEVFGREPEKSPGKKKHEGNKQGQPPREKNHSPLPFRLTPTGQTSKHRQPGRGDQPSELRSLTSLVPE